MGTCKNGRSNIFPITYRILIYNVWAASMILVDKLEASLWIGLIKQYNIRRHLAQLGRDYHLIVRGFFAPGQFAVKKKC